VPVQPSRAAGRPPEKRTCSIEREVCVEGSQDRFDGQSLRLDARRWWSAKGPLQEFTLPACRRECAAQGSGRRLREDRPVHSTRHTERSLRDAAFLSYRRLLFLRGLAPGPADRAGAAAGRAENTIRPPPAALQAVHGAVCRSTRRSAASARRRARAVVSVGSATSRSTSVMEPVASLASAKVDVFARRGHGRGQRRLNRGAGSAFSCASVRSRAAEPAPHKDAPLQGTRRERAGNGESLAPTCWRWVVV